MNYLGTILASSSTHWSAQLAAERKQHRLGEISVSLKPVRIPLMSINGCLGMPWSPQHGWDLQPLNLTQSQRLGLTGFTGRYILLTAFEACLQSVYTGTQMITLSWSKSVRLLDSVEVSRYLSFSVWCLMIKMFVLWHWLKKKKTVAVYHEFIQIHLALKGSTSPTISAEFHHLIQICFFYPPFCQLHYQG